MKRALVVGGANGLGLGIATCLSQRTDVEKVYIVDKVALSPEYHFDKFEAFEFDLTSSDYSFFDRFADIDTLIITAGFGRLALFKDIDEQHIINSFNVNTLPSLRLIHKFYTKLEGENDFYCGIMVSIAGYLSSPFYAVYGATKAALRSFIESVNVELKKGGSTNCVMNVSAGSFKGSSFNGGKTDLSIISETAETFIEHLEKKEDLYIFQYEEIFREVLERYHTDFRAEGNRSYDYKLKSGRL